MWDSLKNIPKTTTVITISFCFKRTKNLKSACQLCSSRGMKTGRVNDAHKTFTKACCNPAHRKSTIHEKKACWHLDCDVGLGWQLIDPARNTSTKLGAWKLKNEFGQQLIQPCMQNMTALSQWHQLLKYYSQNLWEENDAFEPSNRGKMHATNEQRSADPLRLFLQN